MSEIFAEGLCAHCNSNPWRFFCRGCCLVFCAKCRAREIHHCARRDEHKPPSNGNGSTKIPKKKPDPVKKEES